MDFARCYPPRNKITRTDFSFRYPFTVVANVVVIFVRKKLFKSDLKNFRFEEREKSFRNGSSIILLFTRSRETFSSFRNSCHVFAIFFYFFFTRGSLKILSRPRVKAVNFSRIVIPTTRVSVLLHNAATVRTRKSRWYEHRNARERFDASKYRPYYFESKRSSKKKKKENRIPLAVCVSLKFDRCPARNQSPREISKRGPRACICMSKGRKSPPPSSRRVRKSLLTVRA